MEIPFVYGKIATGNEFTDREKETKHLVQNFKSNTNTIIISPRRWGKSSLVTKAANLAKNNNKNLKICFIDLFSVRNEGEFYKLLAEETIKSVSTQWEGRIKTVKEFFKQYLPKISFSSEPSNEFSLGLNWSELAKQPEDILNLPEKISSKRNIHTLICIDEFQNISVFDDPLSFQKKLRAHWQYHQNVSYCLYGSKRHMMMEVFTHPSMPFYKFGDLLFLQKIVEADWINFIIKRFKDTGKKITATVSSHIANCVEFHPYYVQQLAQLCWFRTREHCDLSTVTEALDSLFLQLGNLFQTITYGLSKTQLNFLKAMCDDIQQFSAKETLTKYTLGTSGNISRIKQALLKKEIIDIQDNQIFFNDPVYKLWLKDFYFKI